MSNSSDVIPKQPSQLINAIVALQDEFKDVPGDLIDQHFTRALRVKNGVVGAAQKLASVLVKTYECTVRRSLLRGSPASSSQRDPWGMPWLQLAPMTTVLIPTVGEMLPAKDVASLRSACPSLVAALRSMDGANKFAHVTERVKEAVNIHPSSVKSISIEGSAEELSVDVADTFTNCRRVYWTAPGNWRKCRTGEFLESRPFSVQGVEGFYFRFYPQGKEHSRRGFCSLYIGSNGTARDVSLKLWVGTESHIITQRLHNEFVDGFVNFCDLTSALNSGSVTCGLEIVCGPRDNDKEEMRIDVAPRWATWTIPRMTSDYVQEFQTGDRITSDVFTVDGLGEDACFVLYPKGDTVDAISKVGDFVNVGLFGSSTKDVTFRLSAGGASKVLTACSERYQSKTTGQTKSCGEFFDACFAPLEDMLDGSEDRMRLTLEVLDSQATQYMTARGGLIKWRLQDLDNLVSKMAREELLHSRYFTMAGSENVFFAMELGFLGDELQVGLATLNQANGLTEGTLELVVTVGGRDGLPEIRQEFRTELDCAWTGYRDCCYAYCPLPSKRRNVFEDVTIEMKLLSFVNHTKADPDPSRVPL